MPASLATMDSLDQYVSQINRHKLLTKSQEQELAFEFLKTGATELAHRMVVSNLRFVVKVAHEYKGYNLKILDLIQEGNIGLMMAVKKFDPEKGYRLISYAVWWIRAYIQNYIIRSWSLVKMGTTQAQRKLFFKMRSEREKAKREAGPDNTVSTADLAERLGVKEKALIDMEMRMASRDFSLDMQLDEGSRHTHLDLLADSSADQEKEVARAETDHIVRGTVTEAMETLNEKERFIIKNRLMTDEPQTLQEIGSHFSISRERARQIEGNVLRKMKKALETAGIEKLAA